MLTKQPSHSLLKKKGGTRGELARMHLAVYPFEVHFLSTVQYKTFFHFQKNYQILGQMSNPIPSCRKGQKHQLRDIGNLINFKLHSSDNVVYKWSLYRKHASEEEEYIQSCTIDLKEIVNSHILPQKNQAEPTSLSLIELGFSAKEMRLKFTKTGVILLFMLFICDDQHKIIEYVQNKLIRKQEDNVIENIPIIAFLKGQSNSALGGLSSRRNQNSGYSFEDLEKKKSSKKISNESLISNLKPKENLVKIYSNPKMESRQLSDHIGKLIDTFEVNQAESNYLLRGPKENRIENQPQQQNKEQILVKQESDENEKKNENRDYGMLKLQERTLGGETFLSQTLPPLKNRANKQTKQNLSRKQSAKLIKEQSQVSQSKFSVRKVAVIALVSIFLLFSGVILSKGISKKPNKRERK